jgi:hypothetical protein
MNTALRPYAEKVHTFTALSADNDQTAFQLPKLNEYNFYLDISTLTSSDSTGVADVTLQVSPDAGTTWLNFARFAAATAAGKQRLRFRPIAGPADAAGVEAAGIIGGAMAFNAPLPQGATARFHIEMTGTLTVLTGSIWLIGNVAEGEGC